MKVLVTGGCGLIGFHIAKHYREYGHEVAILDNLERSELLGHKISRERKYYNLTELLNMGATHYDYDVSNEQDWDFVDEGFEIIFHMAGQCGVPSSIEIPRRDFEVNALGTFNVLEYAKDNGSRVIYASTNKVYPLHNQDLYQWDLEDPDEDRWRWQSYTLHKNGFPVVAMDNDGSRTPYGTSKYTGDMLCQEYYHTYGVPTGIFRMSCIYGDHQFGFEEQGWATWFAIATLKGLPLKIYGDGKQVRDMLWVEDVVKAYNAFATSRMIKHGVWNLGGGPENTLSINESLDMLEEITGKRSEISYHDWRPSDQRIYTSSISRLKNTFGWEPTVSPREGITRIVKWAEPILDIF